MSKFCRLTACLLALCLVCGLTACGGETPYSEVTPPTTTTTTPPPTTTTTAPALGLNPLTGLEDMETANNRPVGFVITDEDSKHIQMNIESADMYFEAETEGGIPRVLAIYSSIDRVPDTIGPVRSARPHFVKMAAALDMIYCHMGGSASGKQAIKDLDVEDLDGMAVNVGQKNYSVFANSQNYSWNTTAFFKSKMQSVIKSKKYSTTTDVSSPFEFGEETGTAPANTLVVKISESYDMAFEYDAATGLYKKHRNALNTPIHTTYTGGTITAKNVIVMFDRRTVDVVEQKQDGGTTTRYNFDLDSGEGLIVSGGTSRPIRWKRTNSQLTYYEADGTTKLAVAPGKTYICLASNTLKDRTKVY